LLVRKTLVRDIPAGDEKNQNLFYSVEGWKLYHLHDSFGMDNANAKGHKLRDGGDQEQLISMTNVCNRGKDYGKAKGQCSAIIGI
jgi:hypothetical protein